MGSFPMSIIIGSGGGFNDIETLKTDIGITRKNLLYPLYSTYTVNGITFMLNDDNSVTINGTSTATAVWYNFKISSTTSEELHLTGCPTNELGVYLDIRKSGNVISGSVDSGSGATVLLEDPSNCTVVIRVPQGVTLTDFTVYPMLRHADIEDDTYEPYVNDINTRLTNIEADTGWVSIDNPDDTLFSNWACCYRVVGSICHSHIAATAATDISLTTNVSIALVPFPSIKTPLPNSNERYRYSAYIYNIATNTRIPAYIIISNTGTMSIARSTSDITQIDAGDTVYSDCVYMI